jgi:hypothetical protein
MYIFLKIKLSITDHIDVQTGRVNKNTGAISYELIERYTQVSEVSEEALERESIATDKLSF